MLNISTGSTAIHMKVGTDIGLSHKEMKIAGVNERRIREAALAVGVDRRRIFEILNWWCAELYFHYPLAIVQDMQDAKRKQREGDLEEIRIDD